MQAITGTTAPAPRAGADPEASAARLPRDAAAGVAARPLHITVYDSMEAAEPIWRQLEATATLTPYQRHDWLKPLVDVRGYQGGRCAIAVAEDDGIPIALLPLQVDRRFGLTRARLLGSDLSNTDWLVMAHGAELAMTRQAILDLLDAVRRHLGGLDYLALTNLPPSWRGVANPLLAFAHQAAPDHLYYAPIGADGPPLLTRRRRVDIERGKRRLEESFGPVTLRRAETGEEISRVHQAFIEQRNVRFAQMGIKNPFAEPDFLAFFRAAAERAIGEAKPALCFHALYAGEELVATAASAFCGDHYSQYINSNTDGPASRYSLVGLLMFELMEELKALEISSIDMGIGNFAYKKSWTEQVPVFDCVIPLSARGRIAATGFTALRTMKRTIKQNPVLWKLATTVRAALNRHSKPAAETEDRDPQ